MLMLACPSLAVQADRSVPRAKAVGLSPPTARSAMGLTARGTPLAKDHGVRRTRQVEARQPPAGHRRDHHQRSAGDGDAALQGAADAGGDQRAGRARPIVRQDARSPPVREENADAIRLTSRSSATTSWARRHSNAYRQVGPLLLAAADAADEGAVRPRRRAKRQAAARAARLGGVRHRLGERSSAARTSTSSTSARRATRHAEIAIAAAQRGQGGLLREAARQHGPRSAERMLAAVTKAGVTHMICHNYRRAPAVMLAKQLIEDGQLGEICHYRGTYLQDWVADPTFPLRLAPRQEAGRARARSATSPRTRSTSRASWSGEITRGRRRPRRRSSRRGRCPTTRRRRAA